MKKTFAGRINDVHYLDGVYNNTLNDVIDRFGGVGGTAFVSHGLHYATDSVYLPPTSVIAGGNRRYALVSWSGTKTYEEACLELVTSTWSEGILGITVRDVCFWSTPDRRGPLVRTNPGDDVQIDNFMGYSAGNNAVEFISTSHITVRDSSLYDCGIHASGSPPSSFYIEGCNNVVIESVYVQNYYSTWTQDTACLITNSNNVLMWDFCFEWYTMGVDVYGGMQVVVDTCYPEAVTNTFAFSGSTLSCVKNTFIYAAQGGLKVVDTIYSVFHDNQFQSMPTGTSYMSMSGNLRGVRAYNNRAFDANGLNVPWTFGVVTSEPAYIECTVGGTDSGGAGVSGSPSRGAWGATSIRTISGANPTDAGFGSQVGNMVYRYDTNYLFIRGSSGWVSRSWT